MYSTIFKNKNSLPLSVTNMIYILITPNKHGTHNNQEPNKTKFYKPN